MKISLEFNNTNMLLRFTIENVFSFGDRKEFNMLPYNRLQTLNYHRYQLLEI